jgi:hypothetical protein
LEMMVMGMAISTMPEKAQHTLMKRPPVVVG